MNLRLVLMAASTTPPYGVPDRDVQANGTHPATRQQKLSFPGRLLFWSDLERFELRQVILVLGEQLVRHLADFPKRADGCG